MHTKEGSTKIRGMRKMLKFCKQQVCLLISNWIGQTTPIKSIGKLHFYQKQILGRNLVRHLSLREREITWVLSSVMNVITHVTGKILCLNTNLEIIQQGNMVKVDRAFLLVATRSPCRCTSRVTIAATLVP
jgi:hypothetical protein